MKRGREGERERGREGERKRGREGEREGGRGTTQTHLGAEKKRGETGRWGQAHLRGNQGGREGKREDRKRKKEKEKEGGGESRRSEKG